MAAKNGDIVRVHYVGTLQDGTVFDTSTGRDPLEFTIGEGQLLPPFEKAVVGMAEGDQKQITIPADEAYGPHVEEMIVQVERDEFPPDITPKEGLMLQIQQAGQTFPVIVTDVGEQTVTLDGNHPLAGKDLLFRIELVEIRAAA